MYDIMFIGCEYMEKIQLQKVLYDCNGDYNNLYEKMIIIDKKSTNFM